jgi:hypothetical protein
MQRELERLLGATLLRKRCGFGDRIVKYDFGELDEVALAYAITIHSRRARNSRQW